MSTKELTWIGSTSYAAKEGRGDHPGCVCMTFMTVWGYNRYFKKNDKLLVVDHTFYPRLFGLYTNVVAMVTNQLDPAELADMNEVSREIEFAMAHRRKAREEAREEQEQVARATKLEMERLAAVGKRYEDRVKHMRKLDPTSQERKDMEKKLNSGDTEILDG